MPEAVAVVSGGAAILGAISGDRSSKRAAKAASRGQDQALAASQEAADLARSQAIPLFQASQENQQQGFQGALDIFGQSVPQQLNAFQGGNQNAQNTLLAGLNPQMAAILGGQIDLSGLQAQQVQAPPPEAFQHQLPQFQTVNQSLGLTNPFGITGNHDFSVPQQPGAGPSLAGNQQFNGGASPFAGPQLLSGLPDLNQPQQFNPFDPFKFGGQG
jgi:hypothetical protein